MQNYSSKFKILLRLTNFALLIATFNFALLTFNSGKANASSLQLAISPPLIQIKLDPPANVNTPITLQNLGDETIELEVLFKPFTASENENGEVAYFWDKDDFSNIGENPLFFNYISLIENGNTINQLSLAPNQKKTLGLNIEIPKDEKVSDYYFSIIFISKNSSSAELSHSQIQGGIATNVLLSIGKEKLSLEILEFSTPFFTDSKFIPFRIALQNNGKHFITAKADITIKNILGQVVKSIEIDNINVLAERRRFEKYIWEDNPFPGFYSATLNLTFDQNSPILSKKLSSFVFPIKLIIGLGVIIIIVILIRKRFTSKLAK